MGLEVELSVRTAEARDALVELSVRPRLGLSVRRRLAPLTREVREVLSVLFSARLDDVRALLSREPVIFREVLRSRALCSIGVTLSGRTNEPNLGLQAKYRTPWTDPSLRPEIYNTSKKGLRQLQI